MIKLQPGDYVSTEGMTEEQYHAVCKAFMDAGCQIYEKANYKLAKNYSYFGWGDNGEDLKGLYHGGDLFFARELTIDQILGSDSTEGTKEMNLQEAYKVMQANCGIDVGDTVKVLRKAEDYENGWDNQWGVGKSDYIGKCGVVISLEGAGGVRIQFPETWWRYPFFVLELVKKGKKLPEPIRISLQYQCEFKEDGSIAVGCQSLDFELIEKIYMTAKEVKEQK